MYVENSRLKVITQMFEDFPRIGDVHAILDFEQYLVYLGIYAFFRAINVAQN